jgi:YesN/AraC family two-component response regulator
LGNYQIKIRKKQNKKDFEKENKYRELDSCFIIFLLDEKPYLKSDVSQEEFCQKLGTNRTYLSRMINQNYKQSFSDLLYKYRIGAACELLADPGNMPFSIEKIGSMAGFRNNATFHRKFKKQLALTPKQFRDRVKRSK